MFDQIDHEPLQRASEIRIMNKTTSEQIILQQVDTFFKAFQYRKNEKIKEIFCQIEGINLNSI